jgi:hypothetical protein
MRVLGIVLLVLGLVGLAVGTFQYTQRREVLRVGGIRVQANERETVTVPPLAAGAAAVVGLVLVLASRKR